MQSFKILVLLIVCVPGGAVLATAANNKVGVADVHKINFLNSVRIGDVVLPQGDDEIRHVMEGENPLPQKASQPQQSYVTNASKEQVLHEFVFASENAKQGC